MMVRIACAAAALVLLLFTIASSRSQKNGPTMLGNGLATGGSGAVASSGALPSTPAAADVHP